LKICVLDQESSAISSGREADDSDETALVHGPGGKAFAGMRWPNRMLTIGRTGASAAVGAGA
jgi:hypothetical protein